MSAKYRIEYTGAHGRALSFEENNLLRAFHLARCTSADRYTEVLLTSVENSRPVVRAVFVRGRQIRTEDLYQPEPKGAEPVTEQTKDEGGYKFRRRIEDRLREVLNPTDDPKLWTFHEGFNDARIATEFATSIWIVKSVRRQMFGNIRMRSLDKKQEPANDLFAIEAMELRLAVVEMQLHDLRTKLKSLLE
jgi:hypothetical protein